MADTTGTKGTKVQVRVAAEMLLELDELSESYGGRSEVMRAALSEFMTNERKRRALDEYLDSAWAEHGGVDEDAVAAAAKHFK